MHARGRGAAVMSRKLTRRERRAGRVRHEPPRPKERPAHLPEEDIRFVWGVAPARRESIDPIVLAALKGDPYALAGFSAEEAAKFRAQGIDSRTARALADWGRPSSKQMQEELRRILEPAVVGLLDPPRGSR